MKKFKILFTLIAICLVSAVEAQTIPVTVIDSMKYRYEFNPTAIEISISHKSNNLNEKSITIKTVTIDSTQETFDKTRYIKRKWRIESEELITVDAQSAAYDSQGHIRVSVFNQFLKPYGLQVDTSRPVEY